MSVVEFCMTQALISISGRGRSSAARMRFFSVIAASSPGVASENINKSELKGATDAPGFGELDAAGVLPDPPAAEPAEADAGEPPLGPAGLAPEPPAAAAPGGEAAEGEVVTVVVAPPCVTVTVEAAAPLAPEVDAAGVPVAALEPVVDEGAPEEGMAADGDVPAPDPPDPPPDPADGDAADVPPPPPKAVFTSDALR